jgi:hypothetical protein
MPERITLPSLPPPVKASDIEWGTEVALPAISRGGEPAYLFKETVLFTASGTFTKADYPGLRAVSVQCQGGGGGGGGASTTAAGESSSGGGGGAGGYAKSFILADNLDPAEAVTVGAGGAAGSDGNDSIFDTISGEVRGRGGIAGDASGASPTFGVFALGGAGGGAGVGDLAINGGAGRDGFGGVFAGGGGGGKSQLSGSPKAAPASGNGLPGIPYGGGGSGAWNDASEGATKTGGAGAIGIVIVDVFV